MKKILAIFLALAVISCFVACSKQEMKDDMTTLKNEISTMLDDATTLFDGTTEEDTTEDTTDDTTENTTVEDVSDTTRKTVG